MRPEYVFVVGSFRSGTTLMYNILNSSDDIAICWETHFLGHFLTSGHIKEIRKAGPLQDDANVYQAVEIIYGFEKGYWKWLKENVDKAYFTKRMLDSSRRERDIFELLMDLYAGDKPIRGEKTPAHLYYVPTLLDWFPGAKIIHTIRDPRAIFLSELRKKKQQRFAGRRHKRLQRAGLLVPYILFQVTLTWMRATRLDKRYAKLYPNNYFKVRFEDLVSSPEECLSTISDYLCVDLGPTLFSDLPSNSSFEESRESTGLDTKAANRWQTQISPWVNQWFLIWCGGQMAALGYT